ncbi:MAG TPA: DUF6249 domain-containing protein [Steroidobacteraceae bacterium]|jgi:hypothetical protein
MNDSAEVLVPLFGMIFAIGLPVSIPIVMISLNYRKRRRLMELHHVERMAAIERGMEIPPLPLDLIDNRSPRRRRTSLLPGLVWFFIGLAVVVGAQAMHDDEIPVISGLIPLGIGLAYLIYYFAEGRKLEARQFEHDLAESPPRNEGR